MIRKLADGKFRLYSRKKINVPESAGTSGRFPHEERRWCTSVRSSISSGTDRKTEVRRHFAALSVVRHTEFLFTAIEDQRHDQILFIVEMPDQSLQQHCARIGVGVAAAAQSIRIASQRL